MVLFYCDLRMDVVAPNAESHLGSLRLDRKRNIAEVGEDDILRMIDFRNPAILRRQLSERFGQGASLWLARSEGELAGYGWTIAGRTVKPHFYVLGENDVHLFDFFVFPEYRGRQINPTLVTHILHQFTAESKSRAYNEAAEWNHTQLSSLRRTGFIPMGFARKASLFGRTLVEWSGALSQAQYKIDQSATNNLKSGSLASR
jgi:GNAT superfamily N-acetyltransferase